MILFNYFVVPFTDEEIEALHGALGKASILNTGLIQFQIGSTNSEPVRKHKREDMGGGGQ